MPSKVRACYEALQTYGFMISGPKNALVGIERWPKAKKKETFKQWKERVFKKEVKITVYAPYEPAPQSRMSTLAKKSGGEHLNSVFISFGKFKDKKLAEAVGETEQQVVERLSTFPKETLASLLDEFDGELQPSVKAFFDRYTNFHD